MNDHTSGTLLRIDASARTHGSVSRALADHAQACWLAVHPGGRVLHRDLAADPVPHLGQATIEAFQAGSADPGALLSDALIAELYTAEVILIASPLYNFGVPSPLKAWVDHVVRVGRTFRADGGGFTGLLGGKRAVLVTVRGGHGADDFQTPLLETVLRFVGFTAIDVVAVEDTAAGDGMREARVEAARARIARLFACEAPPQWAGDFTDDDRAAIAALRVAQAEAIERGDADAYARLCADDVHLMLPGQDVVIGREALRALERTVFGRARFASMRKVPLRVERGGDLAIEVGHQEVAMENGRGAGGIFASRQKYTHVFRKTPAGWRFAVLMSSPNA